MIQRIQTVFLLLTVIVTGLLFYMPVITLNMPGATPEQTDIFNFTRRNIYRLVLLQYLLSSIGFQWC